MRTLFCILLLCISETVFSQKQPEIDALNRVILNHKDSIIYAHLLPSEDNKKVTASDKFRYSWYAQHDIKETRGGFDGKLLHGLYTEYYETKDLKTKGIFKKGLKKGKWKSWYKNGELSEVVSYRNGLRHGKYISYDQKGIMLSKGKFKKDILLVKKEKRSKAKDSISVESKKEKKSSDKTVPSESPKKELKKEKKKKEKEPKVRVRRSIKVVPQPGKST